MKRIAIIVLGGILWLWARSPSSAERELRLALSTANSQFVFSCIGSSYSPDTLKSGVLTFAGRQIEVGPFWEAYLELDYFAIIGYQLKGGQVRWFAPSHGGANEYGAKLGIPMLRDDYYGCSDTH